MPRNRLEQGFCLLYGQKRCFVGANLWHFHERGDIPRNGAVFLGAVERGPQDGNGILHGAGGQVGCAQGFNHLLHIGRGQAVERDTANVGNNVEPYLFRIALLRAGGQVLARWSGEPAGQIGRHCHGLRSQIDPRLLLVAQLVEFLAGFLFVAGIADHSFAFAPNDAQIERGHPPPIGSLIE